MCESPSGSIRRDFFKNLFYSQLTENFLSVKKKRNSKKPTMNIEPKFVNVAVDRPVFSQYLYAVPENLKPEIEIGKRVLVPFGRKILTGYVIKYISEPQPFEVKEVLDVLDDKPLLSTTMLKLCQWISKYYFAPLGLVIKSALPAGINMKSLTIVRVLGARGKEQGVEEVDSEYKGLDKLEKKIYEFIKERGEASIPRIQKELKLNQIYYPIKVLRTKGLVETYIKLKGPMTYSLKIKYARTNFKKEDFKNLLKEFKVRSKKECEVLRIAIEQGEMPLKDLISKTSCSSSTIKSLKNKGLLEIYEKKVLRDPYKEFSFEKTEHFPLNNDQTYALNSILEQVNKNEFCSILLHGVTGSGKTEVYIQAINHVIANGKKAIVLVPEISLTPQLISRFKSRFGEKVAVLHSALMPGERFDEWQRIYKGIADIAIGARSAIFAPFENLGLIVVDEEHDSSYKQEEVPCYNARDTALVRGKLQRCTVILGSATPSLESFYNAKIGKYNYQKLESRIGDKPLPEVEIVDMRKEFKKNGNVIFSEHLIESLESVLNRNKQAILFINRRGFANFVQCTSCGESLRCRNCSVTLTYHKKEKSLKCHYCDFSLLNPETCPNCNSFDIKEMGMGTQRLEEDIKNLFPKARVSRFDRDAVKGKYSHQKILKKFEDGEIDILIGTQMLSKGHDYPNVALACVVLADLDLNFPDLRAAEKGFQLLVQVSGRAGRDSFKGKSIIQTLNPEHYCIKAAKDHDYLKFFEKEISFRKRLRYPPFRRIANIIIKGDTNLEAKTGALEFKRFLVKIKSDLGIEDLDILGPAPALLHRLRGKYRWQIILKSKEMNSIHSILNRCKGISLKTKELKRVFIHIDVDPVNLV